MSPEQARGEPVDRRADIWAFSAVVFEMLTGKKAFEGEDVSLTLSAVLQQEPAWDALPGCVPPVLNSHLHRCLEKDPRQRIRDIGDVRLAMEDASSEPIAQQLQVWQRSSAVAVIVLTAATITGVGVWSVMRQPDTPAEIVRFAIAAPEISALVVGGIVVGGWVILKRLAR